MQGEVEQRTGLLKRWKKKHASIEHGVFTIAPFLKNGDMDHKKKKVTLVLFLL